jgi:hypothetical protein
MEALEAVKDTEGMKKELWEKNLLRKDLKSLVGYVTPYIPHWNTMRRNHRRKAGGQYEGKI